AAGIRSAGSSVVLPISLADFLWPDFLWVENSGESRESNEIYLHADVAPGAGPADYIWSVLTMGRL
ncbi:hypothetical protein ACC771_10805, partial [Rhizobium ruizarguesonis]